MRAARRDVGLLYRIRDLHAANKAMWSLLESIEDAGWLARASPADLEFFRVVMKSAARVQAIEEGKQRA